MAGGGDSYVGFYIPLRIAERDAATYEVVGKANAVTITGKSKMVNGSIQATIDADARFVQSAWKYLGAFEIRN
jgi:hypothetical protein